MHDPRFIPYGRQLIDEDDLVAAVEALRSDWLTTGPSVEAFEQALAAYCGAKHAVAVSNGTAALHVAMLVAGIGHGDRVLTSANTFLASANCAEFVGAMADFADIDPRTYNVTAETLEAAWKADVRAVVPVDFAGQPCDMPAIATLARERGAVVIEDASHAIGSRLSREGREYRTGGHPWADMTTFSFHPVKTITTGEGGAILTNDDRLAERCRLFRNHGIERGGGKLDHRLQTMDQGLRTSDLRPPISDQGPWYYEMHEVGFNYRITDIQCALGLSQLKKLDRFVSRRQQIVDQYNASFAALPHADTPIHRYPDTCSPAWHLYVLQIDFAKAGLTRTEVMEALKARGVGTQVHYIPVHTQPYYARKYGYAPGKCPVAEAYYSQCLSLPLFPAMSDEDVAHVTSAVREVLNH